MPIIELHERLLRNLRADLIIFLNSSTRHHGVNHSVVVVFQQISIFTYKYVLFPKFALFFFSLGNRPSSCFTTELSKNLIDLMTVPTFVAKIIFPHANWSVFLIDRARKFSIRWIVNKCISGKIIILQ